MKKWGRARGLYAVAAVLVLGGTGMFLATRNYVCSGVDSGAGSSCGELTAADFIAHAVIAVIGIGFGIYFVVRAVRATPRR